MGPLTSGGPERLLWRSSQSPKLIEGVSRLARGLAVSGVEEEMARVNGDGRIEEGRPTSLVSGRKMFMTAMWTGGSEMI